MRPRLASMVHGRADLRCVDLQRVGGRCSGVRAGGSAARGQAELQRAGLRRAGGGSSGAQAGRASVRRRISDTGHRSRSSQQRPQASPCLEVGRRPAISDAGRPWRLRGRSPPTRGMGRRRGLETRCCRRRFPRTRESNNGWCAGGWGLPSRAPTGEGRGGGMRDSHLSSVGGG
jgi:hypothetical protein